MKITEFNKPEEHPWEMLDNYNDASEKENCLAWMLGVCIDKGQWAAIEIGTQPIGLVEDGLLEQPYPGFYSLTPKAKGLLYGYYAKEINKTTALVMVTL